MIQKRYADANNDQVTDTLDKGGYFDLTTLHKHELCASNNKDYCKQTVECCVYKSTAAQF
jgi:hypothetical protein